MKKQLTIIGLILLGFASIGMTIATRDNIVASSSFVLLATATLAGVAIAIKSKSSPRTIRGILEQKLPKEIAKQAIKNTDKSTLSSLYTPFKPTTTPLRQAFVWSYSPEGDEYWRAIDKKYFTSSEEHNGNN